MRFAQNANRQYKQIQKDKVVTLQCWLCPFAWEISVKSLCTFGTQFNELLQSYVGRQSSSSRTPESVTPSAAFAISCRRHTYLFNFSLLYYQYSHIAIGFSQNVCDLFIFHIILRNGRELYGIFHAFFFRKRRTINTTSRQIPRQMETPTLRTPTKNATPTNPIR